MTQATVNNSPALAVEQDGIAVALRKLPQWVLWRNVTRDDGRPTKEPFQITGAKSKSNAPRTWTTIDRAVLRYQRGGFDGIGFVFAPDGGLVGIDLDGCRDPATGEIAAWAREVIERFATYAEVSPSGTGVKLWARGKSPLDRGRKLLLTDVDQIDAKAAAIELYDRGRYFAVTGHRVDGTPAEPVENQPAIDWLCSTYFAPARSRQSTPSSNGATTSIVERASTYLAKMPAAVSGQHGHDATFAAACALVLGFDLSIDDARPLLLEYNARCAPPWDEHDIEHKLTDAAKQAGERGYLLNAERNGHAPAKTRPARRKRPERTVKINAQPSAVPSLLADDGRTDQANARRFIADHGQVVRWIDPWGKWLCWDADRWAADQQRAVEALAKATVDSGWCWLVELLPSLKVAEATPILRWLQYSASSRGIANTLALARSEPGIAILPEQLDSHSWLLNCANGVIDLRSGKLLPHNRDLLLTKLSPVEYLQGAEGECPLWESVVDMIFSGNSGMVGFVQRLLGAALVGEIIEHVLPIFYGQGSNGKSLIIETLLEVLGEYGDTAAADLLMVKYGNEHPTGLADLFGKRLVFCVESDAGRKLSESIVKMLTGGDTVHARKMREDYWSFRPSHTLILARNHKPRVAGTDHGLWRRLRLVPFVVRFWNRSRGEIGPPGLEADAGLKKKLRPEHAGILRWLVDGCLAWQQQGLAEPAEVQSATAEYRAAEDTLAEFLADCCTLDGGWQTKASDLRKCYDEWCKTNGEKPVSTRRLGEYLADRGVVKRISNGTWYAGITIN